MATHNINNYINELLNEVHEPGHTRYYPSTYLPLTPERQKKDDALVADAYKDLDRYDRIQARVRAETDRNTKMAQDSRARVDASLASSKDFAKELAAYKAQDKARRARIAGLRSGQGTNQEREARITDSRRAVMSDNAKSIASNILKGFGAGRSTARAEVERRPMPAGRPDDGRPVAEPKPFYHDRRPDDGRPDRITKELPRRDIYKRPEPIGTIGKPIEAGTLGKNKRLAIAAQADKTGDAYMAQVMGQGKGAPSGPRPVDVEKRVGASPDSRIRDRMFRVGRDDQNSGLGIRDPRLRVGLATAGGPNIMPVNKPAIAGQKPRSLSGEIESDFIDYRKPKRMR